MHAALAKWMREQPKAKAKTRVRWGLGSLTCHHHGAQHDGDCRETHLE
jgi:hypothetical protein